MKNSHIEWCDHTFNPWEGCTKVSPGCAHCYAEARNRRFAAGANWGKGAPRRRTSAANWKQPLKWNAIAAAEAGHGDYRSRPKVFCASLADWLDDEVPIEWLADLLELIRITPHLEWLLLTKRPENWRARLESVMESAIGRMDLEEWIYGWLGQTRDGVMNNVAPVPPDNIWLGTTVEDQPRAEERITLLFSIPARVRFLSCEPLLGPVDLRVANYPHGVLPRNFPPGIHWVICGGESGPGARPMHPEWAQLLRDQCAAAGVPFFFKQWGEWAPDARYKLNGEHSLVSSGQHHAAAEMTRVGKLAAGRLLDGKEHSAFPSVPSVLK